MTLRRILFNWYISLFFFFFFDKVVLNKYCSLFQMEQAGSAFDGVSLSLSLNVLW
jgi:hypothetical protein